jgi:hypothetical protein
MMTILGDIQGLLWRKKGVVEFLGGVERVA